MYNYIGFDIWSEQSAKEDIPWYTWHIWRYVRTYIWYHCRDFLKKNSRTYASDKYRIFFSHHANGFGIDKSASAYRLSRDEPARAIGTNIDVYIDLYRRGCPWSSEWKIISRQAYDADCRLVRGFSRCSLSVQRRQWITCNRTPASNCRDVREMGMTDR